MQSQSVENVISRSWSLLTRNWIIIVPGLAIGILVGIVNALLLPQAPVDSSDPSTYGAASGNAVSSAISLVVNVIGYVATITYTTGMAGAAWARGKTTIADGTIAFERDWRNVLLAAFYIALIYVVAALLAVPTLFISLIACAIFLFYVMPAAVVGERSGSTAVRESFQIAKNRFAATLIVIIVIFAIALVIGYVATILSVAPIIGPIVAAALQQAIFGFTMLVAVGEYLNFRGTDLTTTAV